MRTSMKRFRELPYPIPKSTHLTNLFNILRDNELYNANTRRRIVDETVEYLQGLIPHTKYHDLHNYVELFDVFKRDKELIVNRLTFTSAPG